MEHSRSQEAAGRKRANEELPLFPNPAKPSALKMTNLHAGKDHFWQVQSTRPRLTYAKGPTHGERRTSTGADQASAQLCHGGAVVTVGHRQTLYLRKQEIPRVPSSPAHRQWTHVQIDSHSQDPTDWATAGDEFSQPRHLWHVIFRGSLCCPQGPFWAY